jgi:magnesium-transporting ATPase (P-type)
MIKVTATVNRDGTRREVPLREVVPGDVIVLTAGDMIPGDVRLLTAKDLFVIQSALTGESLPSEKGEFVNGVTDRPPTEAPNVCFLGTSVESGSATAVVVETGPRTPFGTMARSIMQRSSPRRSIAESTGSPADDRSSPCLCRLCFSPTALRSTTGTMRSSSRWPLRSGSRPKCCQ